MPTCSASCGDRKSTNSPPTRNCPVSCVIAPERTFSRVDLPAPLSPTIAITSPPTARKLTVSRALTAPYDFDNSRASSTGRFLPGFGGQGSTLNCTRHRSISPYRYGQKKTGCDVGPETGNSKEHKTISDRRDNQGAKENFENAPPATGYQHTRECDGGDCVEEDGIGKSGLRGTQSSQHNNARASRDNTARHEGCEHVEPSPHTGASCGFGVAPNRE